MKKQTLHAWLIAGFISPILTSATPREMGVITVPVADLLGEPIRSFYPSLPTHQGYNSLPICPGSLNIYECCPRIHQALYNQRVIILKRTKHHEVLIALPNAFFLVPGDSEHHNAFWTLSSNVASLSDNDSYTSAIPASTCLTNPVSTSPTIALTKPWHSDELNLTFSAGTRFIVSETNSNSNSIGIQLPNFTTKEIIICQVPKHYCMAPQPLELRRSAFVTLLKHWAHLQYGAIPYVWGGCSVVKTCIPGDFSEITEQRGKKTCNYYQYANDTSPTKTGLDCASMIMCAAQIVGIPFYMKNTHTISQKLKPLAADETLEEGDIIFIRGHVMVVADVVRNTLIEARGYPHGYGCVHEIALADVFEGINTYTDLIAAEKNKTPLVRKNKKGEKKDTFHSFLLLKLKVD